MTAGILALISLAGGVGALCRYGLDGVITRSAARSRLPWGTGTINITGSLMLGLITGAAASHLLPEDWQAILGTGFLGGYTTFSTASVLCADLVTSRRPLPGILSAAAMLVLSTSAAGFGLWLGAL